MLYHLAVRQVLLANLLISIVKLKGVFVHSRCIQGEKMFFMQYSVVICRIFQSVNSVIFISLLVLELYF